MIVSRYTPDDFVLWNESNRNARNSHFLFDRDFMDYHRDRFLDWSLIVRDEEVLALLPANRVGDTIYSHQGLTFGGLILSNRATTNRVLSIFDALKAYSSSEQILRLVYKAIPSIYHLRPASEDLYALFRFGAQLVRRDLSTTIDLANRGPISNRRIRAAKKSSRHGLVFCESYMWQRFWEILTDVLSDRHGVAPVHSLPEILSLSDRFPEAIRLFVALEGAEVVAGTVIFLTPTVAHAQYIAASSRGREIGALDGLFEFLIEKFQSSKRFFDFGISTEDLGQKLNVGLLTQKEEFGGSAITHDVYEVRW